MTPLLSVILPARNAAAALPDALDSLRAQTFRDFELIALDHGSSDATPDLLARVHDTFAQLRKSVMDARVGFAEVLNHGLAQARGVFVARMDADDVAHPERFARQIDFLQRHPDVGVVSCRVAFGGDRRAAAGYARHVDQINALLTHDDMALARFRESPLAHPSVVFRREIVDRFGGYRGGSFPEDYELWLRWFDAGVRFAKLPETLLTWNDPPGRLSRTDPRYSFESFYQTKAGYLARWLEKHNPFHPDIVVIGAGRVTRRRVELLLEKGVCVTAWAELDPAKIGRRYHGAPVIRHKDIPPPGRAFLVPFVSAIGAPERIRAELESSGYVCGRDFIEAA